MTVHLPTTWLRRHVRTLDRYIFHQLLIALLATTGGLAALIWLMQSLRFVSLVVDRGLSFRVFLEMTCLLSTSFLAVIPLPSTALTMPAVCPS